MFPELEYVTALKFALVICAIGYAYMSFSYWFLRRKYLRLIDRQSPPQESPSRDPSQLSPSETHKG